MGLGILHRNEWISSRVVCTCLKAEKYIKYVNVLPFSNRTVFPLTFNFFRNEFCSVNLSSIKVSFSKFAMDC